MVERIMLDRWTELKQNDSEIPRLLWIAAALLVAPFVFAYAEDSSTALQSGVAALLYAFSWPLLLLGAFVARRLRQLRRLSSRGVRATGKIESIGSRKLLRSTRVRIYCAGKEQVVSLSLPRHQTLYEGKAVTVLVDPANMKVAAITGAA